MIGAALSASCDEEEDHGEAESIEQLFETDQDGTDATDDRSAPAAMVAPGVTAPPDCTDHTVGTGTPDLTGIGAGADVVDESPHGCLTPRAPPMPPDVDYYSLVSLAANGLVLGGGGGEKRCPRQFVWQTATDEIIWLPIAYGCTKMSADWRFLCRKPVSDERSIPVVWHDGAATPLPPLPGHIAAWVSDMNESGIVVGTSDGPGSTAVVWRNFVPEELPSLGPAYKSKAGTISPDGGIIGGISWDGTSYDTKSDLHVVLWRDGELEDLGWFGTTAVFAAYVADIASNGTIALQAHGQAYVIPPGGERIELHPLEQSEVPIVIGVNRHGTAIGRQEWNGLSVIWRDGTPQALASVVHPPGIDDARFPLAIRDDGAVLTPEHLLVPAACP
jgi:hypothetical protein